MLALFSIWMTIEKQSPCKVNLLLNILGKRSDGFHELETVLQPIPIFDHLSFSRVSQGVHLTCSDSALPTDSGNLVNRAAAMFLERAGIKEGVEIHLQKNIPLAAGLGGGSADAATTLLGLDDLFDEPLRHEQLVELAKALGSDVPFFLQTKPALAIGRGENIQSLDEFPALRGAAFILVHPGFGIPTAWAYRKLAEFPHALQGRPGRAQKLISLLQSSSLEAVVPEFYNSLEAPALQKYPLLSLFQDFFRENGAAVTLMSGSGSSTFAVVKDTAAGERLAELFQSKFGKTNWIKVVAA